MGCGRVLDAVLGDEGGRISPLYLLNLTLEMEHKGAMIYVNFCSLLVIKFWLFFVSQLCSILINSIQNSLNYIYIYNKCHQNSCLNSS